MSEPASFMVQEMKQIENRKWSRATATVFLFKTFQIVFAAINQFVIPVTGEITEFWIFASNGAATSRISLVVAKTRPGYEPLAANGY